MYVSTGIRAYLAAFLRSRKLEPKVIYLNSFYTPIYSLVPQLLYRLKWWPSSVLLIAPRGEFDPGAQDIKPIKKKIFNVLYRLMRFHKRAIWHASTNAEATNIKKALGPSTRVLIKENETLLPASAVIRSARAPGKARILFASRLSPKKGLDVLLAALRDNENPVELNIIGDFEDSDYERTCLRLAKNLPQNVEITFFGAMPHSFVLRTMENSDILALPTAGENFGHVIPEALSTGCPVMTQDTTPWSGALRAGGGFVVSERTIDDWRASLNRFLNLDQSDWNHLSRNASQQYNKWKRRTKEPHIFTQALALSEPEGTARGLF